MSTRELETERPGRSVIPAAWLPSGWRTEKGADEHPLRVSVRKSVRDFDDVRSIMDSLREGQAQIVCLESVPAVMARRFADMLAGAAFSLGGATVRVGPDVYLFTPPAIQVEIPAACSDTV